jgi:hypothetical protein
VAVLDPGVVVRADWGEVPAGASRMVRGARAVAEQALSWSRFARFARPALVNGAAGIVAARGGSLVAVLAFTVSHDRIVEIDILAGPTRLRGSTWPPWTTDGQRLGHAGDARPDP